MQKHKMRLENAQHVLNYEIGLEFHCGSINTATVVKSSDKVIGLSIYVSSSKTKFNNHLSKLPSSIN